MSMGCFGDCGMGADGEPVMPDEKKKYKLVFHPPIQTVLREKDTQKWYTDMVNELATLGDDPNQLNEFGEAPLCVAAYKAQGLVVEELLQRENIRVNIKGKHGRTPLYLSAEEGHVFIVKVLLAHHDIDVNCKNSPGGATALMGASRQGHSRIVELLLQHPRCDPEATDREGNSALHHARTPSVKWKLHNHTYRSRSLETVVHDRARTNLCHVSPPDLSGPSDSLENSPGTPLDIATVGDTLFPMGHRSMQEFPDPDYSPPHDSQIKFDLDVEENMEEGMENKGLNCSSLSGSSEGDEVWGSVPDGDLTRRPLLTSSRSGSPNCLRNRLASHPTTKSEISSSGIKI